MSQYQLVTDCFFEKTKVGGDVDTKDSAAAGMEILLGMVFVLDFSYLCFKMYKDNIHSVNT